MFAHALLAAPTVTFDLVHVELSLQEVVDLLRHGAALLAQGLDLLRQAYCSLPFVRSC